MDFSETFGQVHDDRPSRHYRPRRPSTAYGRSRMPPPRPAPPFNARGWRMDGIIRPDKRRPNTAQHLRFAVRYTEAEMTDIAAQFSMGFRLQDIADYHQRPIGGILTALRHMGLTPP